MLFKRFLNQIAILIILLSSCSKSKVFTENDIQIIPKPRELKITKGFFEFSKNTKFVTSSYSQKEISNTLISKFNTAAGWNLEIVKEVPQKNYFKFSIDPNLTNEGYLLNVTKDNIILKANGNAGFLYGLESLRQLLPTAIESSTLVKDIEWRVPNLLIQDEPRFKWRGLMLDVSRHFFELDYLKETIDAMAMLKLNVLHLHLIDHQGWRIEIKKYPKLTNVGAWRVPQKDINWRSREVNDPDVKGTYGGFYTQEQLVELINYATSKNIEIIPEIEMPGHVSSAIAAYPELSCTGEKIAVPSGGNPNKNVYCGGKESTYLFLEDVLKEVMEIFPSRYIHIGGDEAQKFQWKKCKHCQNRIKKEGLKNEDELQSYFIKRMEKFINAHDKKLIGWDEILEGGLAPDATVMSWRGVKGGIEAAKQGHNVIMTPNSHCYFDHFQGPQNEEPPGIRGYLPLSKVYQFDPVVESMSKEEASYVLGGQANLWAEYIPTEEHSQYMLYPRLAALAETVWSPKKFKDWVDFSERITSMFKRYKLLGINYAKSVYSVTADAKINIEEKVVEVILKNEFPKSDIRYSTDGNELNSASKKYTEPIKITETTNLKASLFENDKPIGRELNQTIKFHKAIGKRITYNEMYSDSYKGVGKFNMINTLRGTKNFRDGQWQAWLDKDMEVVIDLEKETSISQVIVGSMENQGPGIYYPTKIEVFISEDGKNYKIAGSVEKAYAKNAGSELKDFKINFSEQKARFVKVVATSLKQTPTGGSVWLFIDEILID